ncbi:Protein crooked neck, partial [Operophtera brumata]
AEVHRTGDAQPTSEPRPQPVGPSRHHPAESVAVLIYERFVMVHPDVKNWIKYAKFEENHGFINGSRKVFERAVEFFGDEDLDERLFIAFAKFEENQKEHDRARVIYKSGIEDVIVNKRKYMYEQEVIENPTNYDAWFDYIRLVENEGHVDDVRDTYERAIANVPPSKDKQFWRRYIYLWVNYALYEELEAEDVERTKQVGTITFIHPLTYIHTYTQALTYIRLGHVDDVRDTYEKAIANVPPSKDKQFWRRYIYLWIWLMYAQFEVRCKDLKQARKTLGLALGMCPRDKLYRGYIDLEIQLREFDRCRILYQKFLEYGPENCITWIKFAELETLLGDIDRARAIYEIAVGQPRLDMPELLWKSYIDFEVTQGETEKARQLYERLLERTVHVKVWLSYAKFELNAENVDNINVELARRVYERANDSLRSAGEKEARVLLLEAWKDFETEIGEESKLEKVMAKMPRRVKKRQKIISEAGVEEGWEEIFDYIFPEDEMVRPNLKLLAAAKNWRKQKEDTETTENLESVESDKSQEDEEQGYTPPPREKEARVLLLEAWKDFETEIGEESKLEKVMAKMPRRVKKRQKIISEAGVEEGWEEIFDYIFPEDEMVRPNLKLLAAAKNWRKQKEDTETTENLESVESDKSQEDEEQGYTPPPSNEEDDS